MFGRLKTCALLVLLLAACQSQQHQKTEPRGKDKSNQTTPVYIGTIHQVYPEHQFALVRLARMVPKPGTTLISHPPDSKTTRMANLCVSNEKIKNSVSQMIAADIRSGTAFRGDAVYVYRNLSTTDAKAQEADLDFLSDDLLEPVDNALIDGGGEGQVLAENSLSDAPSEGTPPSNGLNGNNTPKPAIPTAPAPTAQDRDIPSYIDKIPDSIEGWE